MEADEVTEEPYTTMDAEEHPSSKDPSAEDLKEHPVSKTSSEPSTSEMPLEPFTAKSLFVPSPSQTPLETHTSESPLEPPISETALEPPTSESPLVPSASEIPLEAPTSQSSVEPLVSETPLEHTISDTFLKLPVPEAPVGSHISKAPEKHLTIHSAADYISVSCPDALREDLYPSQSSTSDVPQARRSILKDSEYEIVQTHSFSGLSARVHMDTSSNQREEAEEFEEEVNATDSTSHRSQPGQHLGKKKGKKAVSHYTVHPVVPAKQAELVAVAKTMHREKFSPRVNHLFQWEKDATLNAIQTGLYIGWRCPHYLWDCFRIGDESKCFCGHLLREHHIISGCCCSCFESNFLCVACDRRWEEHETFFETEETRRRGGRPYGADYVPFAEMPALREAILSNSDFKALKKQGTSGHPCSHPAPPGLPGPHSPQSGPTSDTHT